MEGGSFRVLLVGDSWPALMWLDSSMRDVFAANDHPEIWEKGDVTTESGSTAADWAESGRLQLISDELNAHSSIDVVQLTIGGNDFLAGMSGGGWFQGMPEADKAALLARVAGDVETVIDHILAHDGEMRVLLSFYDYTNFVESLSGPLFFLCNDVWDNLNQPTPEEINNAQREFYDVIAGLAQAKPRTDIVDHYGLMQWVFGYPSLNIPPGTLVPPGDLTLPSPPEAMRLGVDCFHLNPTGHEALGQNLWDGFYDDFFCATLQQFLAEVAQWRQGGDVRDLVARVNNFCSE